jgi:hypothetical protein
MKANELQKHVFSTYITLRYGMAILALAFPLLLYAIGLYHGISLQDSFSHYYFALSPADTTEKVFPMRTWFVGILFALGACLYLYKGFSRRENYALNLAGAFAWGVALFPMSIGCRDNCPKLSLHGACAIALFLCISFVSLNCAGETLDLLTDPKLRDRFSLQYKALGLLMIAAPLVAYFLTITVNDFHKYVFFVEGVGVWAFALYWWRKSVELSITGAEKLAIDEKLRL